MGEKPQIWELVCFTLLVSVLLGSLCVDCRSTTSDTEVSSNSFTFFEPFNETWSSRWTVLHNEKYQGRWNVTKGKDDYGFDGEEGLMMLDRGAYHAAVALFPKEFVPKDVPLIIQYEVKLDETHDCAGAYLKLISKQPDGWDPTQLDSETPYTILFGPDKCGRGGHIQFVFRHKHPKTGIYTEHSSIYYVFIPTWPGVTHLYRIMIWPDNTWRMYLDGKSAILSSLFENVPEVNPSKVIPDPTHQKPVDWIDEEFMDDPNDRRPEDWDETQPLEIPDDTRKKPHNWSEETEEWIPDPKARKPSEWNEEEDGDWVAPMIPNPECDLHGCGKWTPPNRPNPAYRGKWSPRKIPNPGYKGPWIQRTIPNPDFFEDLHLHNFEPPIIGIALDLWSETTTNIRFDNILVTTDPKEADKYSSQLWKPKYESERAKEYADKWAEKLDEAVKEQGWLRGNVNTYSKRFTTYFDKLLIEDPLAIVVTTVIVALPFFFLCWSQSTVGTEKGKKK